MYVGVCVYVHACLCACRNQRKTLGFGTQATPTFFFFFELVSLISLEFHQTSWPLGIQGSHLHLHPAIPGTVSVRCHAQLSAQVLLSLGSHAYKTELPPIPLKKICT